MKFYLSETWLANITNLPDQAMGLENVLNLFRDPFNDIIIV
jgi:hypothetical protein